MAITRSSTRRAGSQLENWTEAVHKTQMPKKWEMKSENALVHTDREVRMLFDLRMPSESLELSLFENEVFSKIQANEIEPIVPLCEAFCDGPIILSCTEKDDNLEIFEASLDSSSLQDSEISSPESIFSGVSSGAGSPEYRIDESSAPFSATQNFDKESSISSVDEYDIPSKEIMDIVRDLENAPEFILGADKPVLENIDPALHELDIIDEKVAQLETYTTSLPPPPPIHVPAQYYDYYQAPLDLNCASVSDQPYSSSQVTNYRLPGKLGSNSGTSYLQYASQCSCCSLCPPKTYNDNYPVSQEKDIRRVVVKAQAPLQLCGYTALDFEGNKKLKVSAKKTLTKVQESDTEIKEAIKKEPGFAQAIRRGARRDRWAKTKAAKSEYHLSTYSFKPPSEFMIKAWKLDSNNAADKTPSKDSPAGIKQIKTEQLPSAIELAHMGAEKRWRKFKHRFDGIDNNSVAATRECYHCHTLFQEVDFYVEHLERHHVYHESYCADPDCPMSVIGFLSKQDLRRHVRNDHLDQYTPHFTEHENEIMNNIMAKKLYNIVFVCQHKDCQMPFYRRDSLDRHERRMHNPNNVKRRPSKQQPRRPKLKPPISTGRR